MAYTLFLRRRALAKKRVCRKVFLMTIDDIQAICTKYPGVTQEIKWEDHLCFCVAGKMFLIIAPDAIPCTASIKVPEEDFEAIAARSGFMPAPYLARYKWVWMDDISRLSLRQWEKFIDSAFRLVASRLSKKIRRQMGLNTHLPEG